MPKDVVSIVSSRICHDLVSPIGAIYNGIELLELSGASMSPELELIRDSVQNANARIEFFRVAFGNATAGAQFGKQKAQALLDAYYADQRTRFDWSIRENIPRAEAKLLFLLTLACHSALPGGGRVAVARSGDGYALSADALQAPKSEILAHLITDCNQVDFGSDGAHLLVARMLSREIGRKLEVDAADSRFQIRVL